MDKLTSKVVDLLSMTGGAEYVDYFLNGGPRRCPSIHVDMVRRAWLREQYNTEERVTAISLWLSTTSVDMRYATKSIRQELSQ